MDKKQFTGCLENTFKFVSPKDYVIYKLTGELSTDYSSAGNLGGVFDIRTKIGQKRWEKL